MELEKYIDFLYRHHELKKLKLENVKIIVDQIIFENEFVIPSLVSFEANKISGNVKALYKYMSNKEWFPHLVPVWSFEEIKMKPEFEKCGVNIQCEKSLVKGVIGSALSV